MPSSISLLVAYPKELIRAGLRAMVEKTGIKIVAEADDAHSTVTLAKKHKPAVVLLDAAIQGGDAFELNLSGSVGGTGTPNTSATTSARDFSVYRPHMKTPCPACVRLPCPIIP